MPFLRRETDLYPATLFELPLLESPWRVAHTRSRQEKALARHLFAHDVAFYLPLRERRSSPGGRPRSSWLPLFPGYLFFRGGEAARRMTLESRLVAQILPVADPDLLQEELCQLHRLQESGTTLVLWEPLARGEAVRIVDGPFRGYSGVVLREDSRLRLLVSITILKKTVAVEFQREVLARVPPSRPEESRSHGAAA